MTHFLARLPPFWAAYAPLSTYHHLCLHSPGPIPVRTENLFLASQVESQHAVAMKASRDHQHCLELVCSQGVVRLSSRPKFSNQTTASYSEV